MTEQRTLALGEDLGPFRWVVLAVALLGLVGNWVLYNWAPPIGSGSPFGIVVGLLAGGYLAFLVYNYVS